MIPSPWSRTARVLRRTGFGVTGAVVDDVLRTGIGPYLDRGLTEAWRGDPGTVATAPPTPEPPAELPQGADAAALKARNAQIRDQQQELTRWWLRRMARVDNPVREKLTFGWHEHFATSAAKVRDARAMLAQNQLLREGGAGGFGELAHAMITDTALIRWLDGQRNVVGSANENLSREFMELFALGHSGGYTEQDVREGARALTGWRIDSRGVAVAEPKRHDRGVKTVLGVTGQLGATEFVDAVLARPESARFVCTRWWRRLATPADPDGPTLDRLLSAYGPRRDCAALVRAVVAEPGFDAAAGTVVREPVEWLVGAMRAVGAPVDDAALDAAVRDLRGLGQVPFDPPSVGGWPQGRAWLTTASTAVRRKAVQRVVRSGDLHLVADAAAGSRIEATAHLLGLPGFGDATTAALRGVGDDPRALVAAALVSPEYLVD